VTYARYDEYQRAMENYWCLRWLEQEGMRAADAIVLRESQVRLEGLPLAARVPSLPALDPGTRVRVAIQGIDFLERNVACTYLETLASAAGAALAGDERDER